MAGLVRVCPINMNTENVDNSAFVKKCLDWTDHYYPSISNRILMASSVGCRYQVIFPDSIPSPFCFHKERFDCICPKLPMALLRICRTLFHEIHDMVYMENRFRVCQTQPHGLRPLLRLSSRAVMSIRSLSIRLNRCCCSNINVRDGLTGPVVPRCCNSCHYSLHYGNPSPSLLNLKDCRVTRKRQTLSLWNEAIHHLATNIQPGQLRLSIICDCADEATAKHVIQPLTFLPRLAACQVRLGQQPGTCQADIAQDIALKLVQKYSNYSFPFLKLPVELQMRVLSHTHLVHPEGTVKWLPATSPALSRCCRRCTDSLEACCCSVLHGAFSTAEGNCPCWVTPKSLFLVNHRFYTYGFEIFFSQNIFQIDWHTNREYHDDNWSQTLTMLLTRFPESAYCHMRMIHVRLRGLSSYKALDSGHGSHFRHEWLKGIALMSKKLVLPRLRLWIEDMSDSRLAEPDWFPIVDESLVAAENEWKLYQKLVQPIVNIGTPFKDFALEFNRPPDECHGELRRRRRQQLERRVMGDNYCSGHVRGLRQQFGERKKARQKLFEPLSESHPEIELN